MDKRDTFDFDETGEEITYITLPQAVIKARQTARRDDVHYRNRLGWQEIVWTEKQSEKRDDFYWIVLRFSQPAHGVTDIQTGEEEFVFDEVGNLVDRQVLAWPSGLVTPPEPGPSSAPYESQHDEPEFIAASAQPQATENPLPQPGSTRHSGVFLASRRRRLAAAIIDLFLYLLSDYLLEGFIYGFDVAWSTDTLPPTTVLLWIIWTFIYCYGASQGWSPGKLVVGIKIVNHDFEKPGWSAALKRELLGKLIGMIILFLGFLWILWDRERRGWHDFIAKTHVIHGP